MSLSKFFIDRPIFAGVISIAIFLAGLIAMPQLPISEYPEVVPPSVVVTALFPGANPETVANTVTTPLEEQINGVENMLYMSSLAASDGSTDPNLAQQLVQNSTMGIIAVKHSTGSRAVQTRHRFEKLPGDVRPSPP